MLTRIRQSEAEWFSRWRESWTAFLPQSYSRQIVILHENTQVYLDRYPPFQEPEPNDERASHEQQHMVDEILLQTFDPETPSCFGMYAGYFTKNDWGSSDGFDEPEGTWVFSGNLPFVLFGAPLKDAVFGPAQKRWGSVFTDLSFVWPEDRSWFLASSPDLAFTIIGANDSLANRLLNQPGLNALEWTQGHSPDNVK